MFCEVNLIKFSVFDSPPAVKNILLLEKSLKNNLQNIRLKRTKDATFLGHGIDISLKKIRWSIINPANQFLRNESFSNLLSSRLLLEKKMRKQVNDKFILKDSNKNIFSGAAYGLSLIQHIYNLDIHALANGSVTVPKNNMAEKIGSWGEKLSSFDFIFLAFFAIKVSWYKNAIMYLNFASESIGGGISSSMHSYSLTYSNVIHKLKYIAEKGLLLQLQNEDFEFESRFLPFSTSRFDHT